MSSHTHCHEHEHACGCGCSSSREDSSPEKLSETEIHFLYHLVESHYYPVAQFILKSSKESDFESIALSPVFITDIKDTMEQVKNCGETLKMLEEQGFLTLDFDIPLNGYSYEQYYNSELFAYFKDTVEKGKEKENFLGDIAIMETGSIAPTDKCIGMFQKA